MRANPGNNLFSNRQDRVQWNWYLPAKISLKKDNNSNAAKIRMSSHAMRMWAMLAMRYVGWSLINHTYLHGAFIILYFQQFFFFYIYTIESFLKNILEILINTNFVRLNISYFLDLYNILTCHWIFIKITNIKYSSCWHEFYKEKKKIFFGMNHFPSPYWQWCCLVIGPNKGHAITLSAQ